MQSGVTQGVVPLLAKKAAQSSRLDCRPYHASFSHSGCPLPAAGAPFVTSPAGSGSSPCISWQLHALSSPAGVVVGTVVIAVVAAWQAAHASPFHACNPAGILAEQSSPCISHKPHTPRSTPAGIVAAVVVAAIVAAVLAAFLVKRRRNSRRQSPPHRQAGKDFDAVVVDGEQCRCF